MAGEEITLNYNGTMENIHRNDRRIYLFEKYQFTCHCDGCDLSEEELKTQNEMCDEFNILLNEMFKFDAATAFDTVELNCLKKLNEIAKNLKTFKSIPILQEIVEKGFDTACQGYLKMCEKEKIPNLGGIKEKKTRFWQDICDFAKEGLEISTLLLGLEHWITKEWIKRNEDPVQYFNEEQIRARSKSESDTE